MPVTDNWTFLIGAAALAGIPLLSGFFSKDEILCYEFPELTSSRLLGLVTAPSDRNLYAFRPSSCPSGARNVYRKPVQHAHESPRVMTGPDRARRRHSGLSVTSVSPGSSAIEGWLKPALAATETVSLRRPF